MSSARRTEQRVAEEGLVGGRQAALEPARRTADLGHLGAALSLPQQRLLRQPEGKVWAHRRRWG